MTMNDEDIPPYFDIQLHNIIGSGRAILVTGAGFSANVKDATGHDFPTAGELAKEIWPIAFPNEAFDSGSSLGEIFRVAANTNATRLREHLELCFTADPETIPRRYTDWFSLPWHRIYTLNIDNLGEAVQALSPPPRDGLSILSAIHSTPGDTQDSSARPYIHLNGKLSDFPQVTFSPPQYGERTGYGDPWYEQFIADTITRSTLYVGTQLDEPPLWHYLMRRGSRKGQEHRPRSWLVTPSLPLARARLLAELNVDLIRMTEEEFFNRFFYAQIDKLRARATHAGTLAGPVISRESYLQNISDMVAGRQQKGRVDFLLGTEPTIWDVFDGFAAVLDFDKELLSYVSSLSEGVVIITGTAGTGKSTSLLRLALSLASQANEVLLVGRETSRSPSDIRNDIHKKSPDVVIIDDIDRFGVAAHSLLTGIARDNEACVIVGAVRTGRLRVLDLRPSPKIIVTQKAIPNLTEPDAHNLIDALTRGHRLGALANMSPREKLNAILRHASGQLLVTMIEVTSGRRFQDKVADEYSQLEGIHRTIYGILCTAYAVGETLLLEDVIIAVRDEGVNVFQSVDFLVRSGYLRQDGNRLSVRHRVIAETAVKSFQEMGEIANYVKMILVLASIKIPKRDITRNRYGRLLIRFLNHEYLKRLIGVVPDVRQLYESLEPVLMSEFHYWLQRGTFELEFGDLDFAETCLRHAENELSADDVMLETTWCYLLLKRACLDPKAPSSHRDANEALSRLEAVLAIELTDSPHTYHVYAVQGLRWIRTAGITGEERRVILERIARQIYKATFLYKDNEQISKARQDIVRALATG